MLWSHSRDTWRLLISEQTVNFILVFLLLSSAGVDFKMKTLVIDGIKVRTQIWWETEMRLWRLRCDLVLCSGRMTQTSTQMSQPSRAAAHRWIMDHFVYQPVWTIQTLTVEIWQYYTDTVSFMSFYQLWPQRPRPSNGSENAAAVTTLWTSTTAGGSGHRQSTANLNCGVNLLAWKH